MWLNKICIILVFQTFALLAYGQREFPPCSAFVPKENDTILAINSHSDFLYAGIENELVVKEGAFDFPYKITTNNGYIFEYENKHIVMPTVKGTAIIKIFDTSKGKEVLKFKKAFFVKLLPPLKISMCDLILNKTATIDKRYLLSCDMIDVYYTDDIIGSSEWLEVIRFSIGYSYGSYYVDYSSVNNKLTEQMKTALRNMRPGQTLNFHIICINQEGVKVAAPTLKMQVY